MAGVEDEVDASPEPQNIRKVPIEADFLYAYSVVPGNFLLKKIERKPTKH